MTNRWERVSPVFVATIVVALALIAFVLWPVQIDDGSFSPTSVAISRAKQQALAFALYAIDYDGQLPAADRWMDVLVPYIKNDDAFRDPTIEESDPSKFGFAFFLPLSAISTDEIELPGETPLTFQSRDLSRNASGYLDLLPYRTEKRDGNVVSFVDGHAVFKPRKWRFEVVVVDLRSDAAEEPQ